MTNHYRNPSSRDCPAPTENPAAQPKAPGGGKYCECLPKTTVPELCEPPPCPAPDCECPTTAPVTPKNCLEEEIAKQALVIAAAEKATALQGELVKMLDTAKKASLAYTRDKYVELLNDWKKQDMDIAELVRKLVCAVPCWRSILECHVCPLLNNLYHAERSLYGEGKLYSHVHNLYDKEYWYTRDVDAKQRQFDRISNVLQSWMDPVMKIDRALKDNRKLIEDKKQLIGAGPGKAIFEVFLRLIPRHLAIAPPADSDETTTRIDQEYTKFCECQVGRPDNCCGPDVGEQTFRQLIIGSFPYLIDPSSYFNLICCLVEHRYVPAKDSLGEAKANLDAVTKQIKTYKDQLTGDWPTNLQIAADAVIPSAGDCCDYMSHEENSHRSSRSF